LKFNLFNISFINGNYEEAFSRLKKGEFMVVPSGPGLATIDFNVNYWNAINNSDFAIPDSSFMVILARLFFRKRIKKLSGPKFLRLFLKEDILKEKNVLFSIDPSNVESIINNRYLNKIGVNITFEHHYVAPHYNKENITDKTLLEFLEGLELKPKFILLNLGGGVQERLGFYIKNNLSYKVGIICTGAAIAFETGQQARIPRWIDDMYLGWFARILQDPTSFSLRYLKAFRLVYVFYLWKRNKLK
jgi:N-acetylglucosaminyldiphosphoundecaprenol N-acetyl-beta-D-mannosaminyltransferase